MPNNFDFDAEADHGIFDNPEKRADGDPAALVDFEDEESVPAISLGLDKEGFVVSSASLSDLSLSHEPLSVDWRNLICLAGPCRWYTEIIRPIDPGEPEIEVSRWCGRLRTWAEQTRLDEARIYGCSAFEPSGDFTEEVMAALKKNAGEMRYIRKEAIDQKCNLGVCASGPCEHFVEIVRHPMVTNEDIDRESLRFCDHLGGLGRLFDVRELPVYACTSFAPKGSNPSVNVAVTQNQAALQAFRDKMARRRGDEEPHDTERREHDWSALGRDNASDDTSGDAPVGDGDAGGGDAPDTGGTSGDAGTGSGG